jgi:AAHS family 3-hydroxyphenylpropionic acid transporter
MGNDTAGLDAGALPVQRASGRWVLGLCALMAMIEGADLQAIGVAAPQIAREFHLSASQMGTIFSAGMVGLLPGALIGGRLADIFGRRRVLLASLALFGLFSLATTQVGDFTGLVVIRLLTGLGLGGAMPNLIALSSEAVSAERRSTAVSAMFAGMPVGAAVIALVATFNAGEGGWHNIFYFGGIVPLLLIPPGLAWLPVSASKASPAAASIHRESASQALFGRGRATTTVAIWISFFCTLIILYFLMNWLPTLIIGRGLTHVQAEITQICFNLGGAAGAVAVGLAMDALSKRAVVLAIYALIFVALTGLGQSASMQGLSVFVTLAGISVVGAQSVLYVLAATRYPFASRGTGVGAAVGVGRFGSIVGPAAAGQLLALGKTAAMVIGATIPVAAIAAGAALLALKWPDERD